MPTEPKPGLAPEDERVRHRGEPVALTVDGQEFRVRLREGEPRTYDFDWLSGPHEYGFALSGPRDRALSRAEMAQAARDFLAQIDPATGYLAD
ncbi:hypothetical protein AB0H57_20690 [Micromonospora sp. NPDC050686]|uniref:hypothetical protein n=1 Tax=Micromonospora sp. NPDC050686 TaxID=3154631 RepID=UPI0034082AAD